MDNSTAYGTPRTTGLPRPMSRLPQLRPPSQLPRPTSPEANPGKQPARQSIARPPPTSYSHRSVGSVASSRSSTSARTISRDGPNGAHPREPLKPASRPQSRHDSAVLGVDDNGQYMMPSRSKLARTPSQQENAYHLLDSPEESDASDALTASPTRPPARRPPRQSLSDRTIETLSTIPTSPAVRRRSSFFNPQSPMPQSRPGSSMSQHSIPKLSYNNLPVRDNGFVRPASPYKRPGSSASSSIPARPTPGRRSISSAMPSAAPMAGISSHKRANSMMKPPERALAGAVERRQVPQPANGLKATPAKARPMSMQVPSTRTPASTYKPRTLARPSATTAGSVRKPSTTASIPESEPDPAPVPDEVVKSSAALRAQIARAKNAHREAASKPLAASASTYSFDECEDPFNQNLKVSPLAKRIDAARRDGRLNIAAMGLKRIPDEVMTMYDSSSMEASAINWSETVDLLRFNAADNQIDEISDKVLPDLSIEELASSAEAIGNQFGGLESLDLHGNLLTSMPMGLRRLERLTVLNLSRNKIDNSIFDIVQHMPSLRELHLNDNELSRDVPESIGQLINIEVLNLQGNKLTSLAGAVRNLVNLRVLNLSNNRFAELPIGSLFSLPALREVYAATNALTGAFFPMTVDIIRSLQILDISNNSLASISFGAELHLPAIQVLNIARNRLFALPNVSSWTNILTFLAEENSLTQLPDGLTSLKKLRTADFKMNSLRTIDPELASMDALETFSVAANPLRDKKFLTMNAAEIKDEMRKRLGDAKET